MNAMLAILLSLTLIQFVYVLAGSVSLHYEPVGCFRDHGKDPRPLPILLEDLRSDIDWYNLNKTIEKCSQLADDKELQYFGIQFYGECWSGSERTYDKDGESNDCVIGVGKAGSISVYRLVKQASTKWIKTATKFIEGDIIGEVSFNKELSAASGQCKKRCVAMASQGCKAVRLYDLSIGVIYCTFFKTVTAYKCPVGSTDLQCIFAHGESWQLL